MCAVFSESNLNTHHHHGCTTQSTELVGALLSESGIRDENRWTHYGHWPYSRRFKSSKQTTIWPEWLARKHVSSFKFVSVYSVRRHAPRCIMRIRMYNAYVSRTLMRNQNDQATAIHEQLALVVWPLQLSVDRNISDESWRRAWQSIPGCIHAEDDRGIGSGLMQTKSCTRTDWTDSQKAMLQLLCNYTAALEGRQDEFSAIYVIPGSQQG